MTPFIEEFHLNDRRMGSKYMIQSMKSQINSLKIVMNDEYLKLINVTLKKEVIAKTSVHQFLNLFWLQEQVRLLSVKICWKSSSREGNISKNKGNTWKDKKKTTWKTN